MNWKETILKREEIGEFHNGWTEDGKLDIDIHIPLTEILRCQARNSFMLGIQSLHGIMAELSETDATDEEKAKLLTDKLAEIIKI